MIFLSVLSSSIPGLHCPVQYLSHKKSNKKENVSKYIKIGVPSSKLLRWFQPESTLHKESSLLCCA